MATMALNEKLAEVVPVRDDASFVAFACAPEQFMIMIGKSLHVLCESERWSKWWAPIT